MKVLLKRDHFSKWEETEVENELEALQALVGGYIEAITLSRNLVLLCDEEGRIKGLPYNTRILGEELVGPLVVCGTDEEEFTDAPSVKDFIRFWAGHYENDRTD